MEKVITPVKVEERTKLGIKPGDTVRVHQKIVETKKGKAANKKETTTSNARTQVFEGLVIAVKHGKEAGASFTVRATLSGIGVERIFPLYAPFIEKIEIVKRSKVRRAKLYFIREKVAREVKRQLRNMRIMNVSTTDFALDASKDASGDQSAKQIDLAEKADEVEAEASANAAIAASEPLGEESPEEMIAEVPAVEEKEEEKTAA